MWPGEGGDEGGGERREQGKEEDPNTKKEKVWEEMKHGGRGRSLFVRREH